MFTVKSTSFTAGSTVIIVNETINTEGELPTASYQRGSYSLTNEFYDYSTVITTSPDAAYVHPYGQLQAWDVWNQYRNGHNKFQATMQGLGGNAVDENSLLDYPSLINRWILNYGDEKSDNRYFMLLTYDINWYSCEWRGTLIEVYSSILGKNYDDNLEFKFE